MITVITLCFIFLIQSLHQFYLIIYHRIIICPHRNHSNNFVIVIKPPNNHPPSSVMLQTSVVFNTAELKIRPRPHAQEPIVAVHSAQYNSSAVVSTAPYHSTVAISTTQYRSPS